MGATFRRIEANNAGVRVEALEWSPESSEGVGIPLVMIPGGTANAWRAEVHGQAAARGSLGARRRHVLGVSRRGVGGSDAPQSGYTPADFAADVRATVEAAGYDHFVLFGHSMGVPISLEFALRYPVGVAALALGDAPPEYIDFKAAGIFDSVLADKFQFADWDEAFEAMTYRTADRAGDRARFERLRHEIFIEAKDGSVRFHMDRHALMQTVEESVRARTSYVPRLSELQCPVLVLASAIGRSPLTPDGVAAYERNVRNLRLARLETDHDLGQRKDVGPLHAELGALLDRIDASLGVAAT